jgi:hypothetical protein
MVVVLLALVLLLGYCGVAYAACAGDRRLAQLMRAVAAKLTRLLNGSLPANVSTISPNGQL